MNMCVNDVKKFLIITLISLKRILIKLLFEKDGRYQRMRYSVNFNIH